MHRGHTLLPRDLECPWSLRRYFEIWLLYNLQLPVLPVENRSMPGEKQLCHNRSAGQLSDHDFPRRIEWQDRCFVCRRIFRVLSNSRCRQQYFHGDQRHVRVEVVFLKTVLAPAIKWTKARFSRRSTHVPNLCPVYKVNALLRLQVGLFLMQNVFLLITFYYYWSVLKRKHCTQWDFYQAVAK